MLCHFSKFIMHKQATNHAKNFRQGVLEVEGVENNDD